MITVPEVVKEIIHETPFLEETLSQNLINLSSLARQIRPEVEKRTMKDVQLGSIIMALKRMEHEVHPQIQFGNLLDHSPDLIVRSNLMEVTVKNSGSIIKKQKKLFESGIEDHSSFITITNGVFETTVIASHNLADRVEEFIENETLVTKLDDLASITVKFSKNIVDIPGVYYIILKSLAWGGIDLVEVVSTYSEFTIILKNEYVDRAFALIKKAFSS